MNFPFTGPKHLIISHQNDPEKVMYKVPLLEISMQLCEISSRRLNLVSVSQIRSIRGSYNDSECPTHAPQQRCLGLNL
jgi:hypothetical protein